MPEAAFSADPDIEAQCNTGTLYKCEYKGISLGAGSVIMHLQCKHMADRVTQLSQQQNKGAVFIIVGYTCCVMQNSQLSLLSIIWVSII